MIINHREEFSALVTLLLSVEKTRQRKMILDPKLSEK
jgi:hypothetical protein